MSDQWLPNGAFNTPPRPRPSSSRGPLYFLLSGAATLFIVLIAIFFYLMVNHGKELGELPQHEAESEQTTTATDKPTPEQSPVASDDSSAAAPSAAPEPAAPARPAPAGALPATLFTTPAQNIMCQINADNVECTIHVYDYPSPGQCEGIAATYGVKADGHTYAGCDHHINQAQVYPYKTAVASNGFACTLEESSVTCWEEKTGHGFELKRSAERLF
ncbi:hypothetical protein [Trueperella sp. LYQ143]|uniref:hypothetical protein n=1 Tax=unclassified Trueperella TaxID=2630174 RepID=UPI00398388B7